RSSGAQQSTGAPASSGGWQPDAWGGGSQAMGSASAYDTMSAAPQPPPGMPGVSATSGGRSGAPAVPGEFIYNDPRNPDRVPQPSEPEEGGSRIVAGVRGGGNWTEPGQTGVQTPPPSVPSALRGSGYDDGVRAFNEGHYDDAIQYFRDYIYQNPQSDYADDAQFWIGESYLRKGMHSNAIKEFNQVVLRYSSGNRSAAALLKLAEVFSQIGDQVDARLSLQKLVNRYPGSTEAAEAYRLLQEMGS
ncbi:MAG: tol-pal system protein YbgF, partial [Candidatus Binatia bacterium]